MKFGILVNEGPYTHEASDTRLPVREGGAGEGPRDLPRVLLPRRREQRHPAHRVPPQDDRNIVKRWSELAAQHKVDLVVCVAAAQRRGLMDAGEAKRNGKDADNIAPGFRISGLGQLIESGIKADRLVVFGD